MSFKPFHTTGIFCTSWKQTKTRDFQMFSEDVERNCGIKWPNEYLENYRYIIVLKFQSIIEFYMDWISFWFLEWLPFPLSKQSDKQLLLEWLLLYFCSVNRKFIIYLIFLLVSDSNGMSETKYVSVMVIKII